MPPAGHNKTTGIGADAFAHVDSRGDKKTHAQHLARLFAGPRTRAHSATVHGLDQTAQGD
ncbi:hypothetical protein SBBP2_180002 [Burkholderiales bacterium]|nr:hypothetical protein SBBP2_180002 [Burkholderiales bacterium]